MRVTFFMQCLGGRLVCHILNEDIVLVLDGLFAVLEDICVYNLKLYWLTYIQVLWTCL